MKGYKHISYQQRIKLEALLAVRISVSKIAKELGFHRSTICREINRGMVHGLLDSQYRTYSAYSAQVAQDDYKANNKGIEIKLGYDYEFAAYISEKIVLEKYSPYAAVQAIRRDGLRFATAVCSRTVYNYIYNGYIPDVTVKHLPMEGKRKRTYEKARTGPTSTA